VVLALAAMVWLAPMAVAREIKSDRSYSGMLIGFYVAALAMIPANFGGIDSLHVVSNSIGFILLGSVYLSDSGRAQRTWIVAVGLSYGFFFLQCVGNVRYSVAAAARCSDPAQKLPALVSKISGRLGKSVASSEAHECAVPLDADALTGGEPFAIPYTYDPKAFERAIQSPDYRPGYYNGQLGVFDVVAQGTQVEELEKVRWAFLPVTVEAHNVTAATDNPLLPSIPLRELHRVYRDELIANEIDSHWTTVMILSPNVRLAKRDH
jgi:hypothetical protein